MNERAVFAEIFKRGKVSRPELAQATGLSKPTISMALADLERARLVRPIGLRTGNAGRAALLYEIRPQAGYVLAVDIGREFVRLAIADLVGDIAARRDEHRRGGETPRELVAWLSGLARALADEAGVALADITLTVFGTPGVHDKGTSSLQLAPNLPGWDRPGSIGLFEGVAGDAPYLVENDVDLAAVGEGAYGLGQGIAHFALVWIGTGIGMGIMIDGKLYRGCQGAAGEISYLPVGEGDPLVNRGRGMLESVASADGVVALAGRLGMRGVDSAKDVFDAARAGDETAGRVVAAEADHIAHALAGIIAVLDPELVVLGGGIGVQAGDMLIGPVTEFLGDLVALRVPMIKASTLGTDAVLLGAMAVGLTRARDLVFERAVAQAPPG
ncbi:sugar kinase [Sphaerisporangium siamense]|uniref:Putative NBD/HSP70 family sugar kinase n=1 Tax=Sphaerisporangium siamense TaxID=795645 RepID=A0A7W7GAC2_9ACTN|nr:ROK family transcriptional regulator [Sphaerisporangium siamense]MBB4701289.1 putative NBD/HSP70 family sugar kinase [Sphaerisporangium siamense]GII87343.1 sugar kinase [Sphaerisporangium siamense]